MKPEWDYVSKWLIDENGRFKNGIDVGCGTEPLSPDVVALDVQPDRRYAHAQFVWDCKDLEIFADNALDFIYSSHCLEDFDDIPTVFLNWWKKLKPGGLMILLLPDMQGGRYPTVEKGGNPSHRTNVGKEFMRKMLQDFIEKGKIKFEVVQEDTIPHDKTCSIDFVYRKIQ